MFNVGVFMIKKVVSVGFYILASLFLSMYLLLELIPNYYISVIGRLVLLCGSCFFLYFGGFILTKFKNDNMIMKKNLWIFFILYLVLLITLTLFDPMWGRNGLTLTNWSFDDFKYYLDKSTNFIPFKTIVLYIREFDSLYSTSSIMFNLFGNVIALMPMGFFLPLLFDKQNNFKFFLKTIILFVVGIEFAQLLTISGSCDIDDIILNTLGAVVVYKIVSIDSINILIRNIFLLEDNKISNNDKKVINKVILGIVIGIALVFGIIKVRDNIYNENLQEYMDEHNPNIKIVDESTDCNDVMTSFYEDYLYIYYYPCMKNNDVYAVINGDKYLVEDVLNGKTKYNISINKMLSRFDYYDIVYIKQNKYEFVQFNVDASFVSSSIITEVSNDIVKVYFDYDSSVFNNGNYSIDMHFIPKKSGNSIVNVKFLEYDTEQEILNVNYKVYVDGELNVKYEKIN